MSRRSSKDYLSSCRAAILNHDAEFVREVTHRVYAGSKPDYVWPVRAARLVVGDYVGSFAFYYSEVALPIHDLNM
jgi:hypothetical protein